MRFRSYRTEVLLGPGHFRGILGWALMAGIGVDGAPNGGIPKAVQIPLEADVMVLATDTVLVRGYGRVALDKRTEEVRLGSTGFPIGDESEVGITFLGGERTPVGEDQGSGKFLSVYTGEVMGGRRIGASFGVSGVHDPYRASDLDADQDGIGDAMDGCPGEMEDFDGFQDNDGCPELDNDKDTIGDVNDA